MKLVHWLLMGGLLHLVQRGGDWAGPQPYQTPLQNVNVALSHVALNNGVVGENVFKNAPISCCISEMPRYISHSYNVTSIGSRMRSMEQ